MAGQCHYVGHVFHIVGSTPACDDVCHMTQVDPHIMGGMVVDIGDKHIDMSISSRVKKIQQLVMQTV